MGKLRLIDFIPPLHWFTALAAAEAFVRASWRLVFGDPLRAVGPALLTLAWIAVTVSITRHKNARSDGC